MLAVPGATAPPPAAPRKGPISHFRVSGLLARQLQVRGVSVAAVLRHARLSETFLRQEKILATTEQFFALWQGIAEVSGDPAVGLHLGGDAVVENGAPLTIAALCSESFRDAVQRAARYKKLTCPEEIRVLPIGERTAVEFVFTLAREMEPSVLVDLCLAWILAVGRRGTGVPLRPLLVELTRPPAHREILEEHFGCRVTFRAARNALVFLTSDLERPFVTRNPEMLAMLGPSLDAELAVRQSRRNVGDEVKAVLKRLLAGRRPAMRDVARLLGLSSRTLQRRLTESGVNFQGLLQEARRDLAHHYLAQETLALHETAYLLGFDDANSFFRAFQRWEGISPNRWRSHRRLEARGERSS